MIRPSIVCIIWAFMLNSELGLALAQQAAAAGGTPSRIVGAVVAVSEGGRGFQMKADDGRELVVGYQEGTRFLRIAPGEKDLSKAEVIRPEALSPGDRVLARGQLLDGGKSLLALQIIVMSHDDIQKKQEAEKAEWQKRSTAGIVAAKDEAAKQITIRIPGVATEQRITVVVTDKTTFRRYAPDSVRYADSRPSNLAEIQLGDQVRVLGDKSEDGSKVIAEQIVSGAFQTLAGTVAKVQPDGSGFLLKDSKTGQQILVKITRDSVLKRFPGFPPGGSPMMGPAGRSPGGMMMRSGPPDLQRLLEVLPPAKLEDLKPGEAVLIASTKGDRADEATAFTLLAGVEPLLAMRQAVAERQRGASGVSTSWTLEMPVTLGP